MACTAVQFTPAGTHCVAGYADGSLRLYGMGANAIMWSAGRHAAPVAAVHCHPQLPLVLSASRWAAAGRAPPARARCNCAPAACSLQPALPRLWAHGSLAARRADGPLAAPPRRRDGMLAVTQATSAQLQHTCLQLAGSPTPLHCLALHPSAATAAATWLDRFVVLTAPWQGPDAQVLASYRCPAVPPETPEGVQALAAFLPHTERLLVFSSPCLLGTVLVFDYVSGSVARSISLPQTICSLAPASDGSVVALGGRGGAVYVVDAREPRYTQLEGQLLPVQAVQLTAGSRQLVAAAGSTLSIHSRDAFAA